MSVLEQADRLPALEKPSGFERGVILADRLFDATQAFDSDVVGSERVAIVQGRFMYEVIEAGQAHTPSSKVRPLADVIQMRELLEAGDNPYAFNQLGYQAHLRGFSERYSALLVAKHKNVLDKLAATATARQTTLFSTD